MKGHHSKEETFHLFVFYKGGVNLEAALRRQYLNLAFNIHMPQFPCL